MPLEAQERALNNWRDISACASATHTGLVRAGSMQIRQQSCARRRAPSLEQARTRPTRGTLNDSRQSDPATFHNLLRHPAAGCIV